MYFAKNNMYPNKQDKSSMMCKFYMEIDNWYMLVVYVKCLRTSFTDIEKHMFVELLKLRSDTCLLSIDYMWYKKLLNFDK